MDKYEYNTTSTRLKRVLEKSKRKSSINVQFIELNRGVKLTRSND